MVRLEQGHAATRQLESQFCKETVTCLIKFAAFRKQGQNLFQWNVFETTTKKFGKNKIIRAEE